MYIHIKTSNKDGGVIKLNCALVLLLELGMRRLTGFTINRALKRHG